MEWERKRTSRACPGKGLEQPAVWMCLSLSRGRRKEEQFGYGWGSIRRFVLAKVSLRYLAGVQEGCQASCWRSGERSEIEVNIKA